MKKLLLLFLILFSVNCFPQKYGNNFLSVDPNGSINIPAGQSYNVDGTPVGAVGMSSFFATANIGAAVEITSGNTLSILADNGLTSTASATDTITIGIDSTKSPTFANVNTGGTVTAGTLTDSTISITGGNLTGAIGVTATNLTGEIQTASQTNITGVGTITTGVWTGTAIADANVADNLTLAGGTIGTTALTLVQGAAPTPTGEGITEWETDADAIKIGDGSGTKTFSNDTTNASTYAATAKGVTNGDSHDHSGGDGGSITALGTVASGTWQGTAVVDTYVADNITLAGGTIGTSAITLVNSAGAAPTTLAVIQYDSTDEYIVVGDGASAQKFSAINTELFAFSDEDTDLTTGTAKLTFHSPNFDIKLTDISVDLKVAPVGSVLTVDVNDDGTSILTAKLTVDASELTSETAATPYTFTSTVVSANSKMTIDIDTVGSSTAGDGGKFRWYWRRN